MKRKKFNQLILSLGITSSLFPYFSYSKTKALKYDYLLGKSSVHTVSYKQHQLEEQTLQAFLKMKDAALKDGIELSIVSAFRSFERQKAIFEKKFQKNMLTSSSRLEAIQKITTYSSIPGTSRHHWGTDLDLIDHKVDLPNNGLLLEENYLKNGAFHSMYKWMKKNAHLYGFIEAYPNNHKTRNGYFFEPWHYSYQPVSQIYLKDYIENEMILCVKDQPTIGLNDLPNSFFENYQNKFILGIHKNLLP